ncbi:MAG: GerMN domain-containing protein [Treponema sp.]
MTKRKKKALSFRWLFWLVFILFIFLLFLINKNTIISVWEKTQAKTVLLNGKKSNEPTLQRGSKLPPLQTMKEETPPVSGDGSSASEYSPQTQQASSPTPGQQNATETPQSDVPSSPPETIEPTTSSTLEPASQPTVALAAPNAHMPATEMRRATLFLVSLDADGSIMRRAFHKDLPKSSSPMTDALNALFAYPTADNARKGVLRTLIPAGTTLRSAWVKDGIAYINVSEAFQYNPYGIDGYLAQLAQVVFTATEFPTVQAVQFLIEGQTKDYLGLEGVWIGSPLSRASFR